MPDIDLKIIIILIFLIFSSTIIAFVRKLKNKIFPPKVPSFSFHLELKNQKKIHIENLIAIIPDILINRAVQMVDEIQTIPEIESRQLKFFEEQFHGDQENEKFAYAATQTFRAWTDGVMLRLADPDNQLPRSTRKLMAPSISHSAFKAFALYHFLGIEHAELMPEIMAQIQTQYGTFFDSYTLEEDEFLLAWGQYMILTNRYLLIFKPDNLSSFARYRLSDIERAELIQTGMKQLK